jgi:microcystin-dependent protein
MSEPFMGEIKLISFNFAPKGFALCDGQLLPINQNQALFSLMGTTYGGDGRVNFGLPDLRGRVPMHTGNGHNLGERAGEEAHTLIQSEMPQHVHFVQASSSATSGAPSGGVPARSPRQAYAAATDLVAMAPATIGATGGSQPHTNLSPYLTLTFVVALQGIFPSRN